MRLGLESRLNPPPSTIQPQPSLGRRSRVQPALAPVPFTPWDSFATFLADSPDGFKQGDHVTIIGPTGTGKTHIALELAELRDYVIFVACKPADPLIADLVVVRQYWLTGKMEVPYYEYPAGSGRYIPAFNRVVFWPRLSPETIKRLKPEDVLRAEKNMQKPAVGGAIGYVRKNEKWCLILDEATWVARDLGLQRELDSALFQFRTLEASLILCGQRPAWMGQYALSQPTHLFLFQTSHHNDIKALGDISGVNYERVIETVANLDHRKHEVLYVNTRTREMTRTIAPPGGRVQAQLESGDRR